MRCWVGIGLVCALGVTAWGQTAKPEFTVVSIRPAARDPGRPMRVGCSGGPGSGDPALYRCTNVTLVFLIGVSTGMGPAQISGPGWLGRDIFDVEARVPAGATHDDVQAMLQSLLAERFGLADHRVTRAVRGFKLVVAKGGSKLTLSSGVKGEPVDPKLAFQADADGYPSIGPGHEGMAMIPGHAAFYRSDEQLIDLAHLLTVELQTPVSDATGLTGRYDIGLRWIPDAGKPGAPLGPGLRDAVREQLGLVLEPTKVQREFLIVDHINQAPVAN